MRDAIPSLRDISYALAGAGGAVFVLGEIWMGWTFAATGLVLNVVSSLTKEQP